MRIGNNIHVQQDKTNMLSEEWKKTQNDAPFVAFYDMRAVTFVLQDEMDDVLIAGLHWFILKPRLNHTGLTGQLIPIPNLIYIKKKRIWNKNYPACCYPTNYGESSRLSLILVGWLVVFGFNATLTIKVISWRSVTHVFPGFITPVLTQLFFSKPQTTFLACFCRDERRKYA